MKFSSVLLFASAAFAAPAVEKRQQTTIVGTLASSVQSVKDAVSKNADSIQQAVQSVKDNTDAQVAAQVQASIKSNYEAIAKALQSSAGSIASATTGALGGVAGGAVKLGQQEVDQLTGAVQSAADALQQLQATIKLTVTDLTPDAANAVKGEIDAVKGTIGPFAKPLAQFADAVSKASATAGVTVTGLANAQKTLIGILQGLASSLGVPGLTGLPSVNLPL